ncbi:MAG: hypothetical protein ACJ8DT_05625, partial [Microvirga sp.]
GKAGHICDVPRNFSYPQVEAAILRNVSELDFHSLLSDESEKVKIDAAERRAAELHERHEAVNRGIETLYTQLEKFETEMAANLTTKRIDRKSTELAAVQAELEVARTELEALRRGAACRARGPATIERLILELETAQGEAKHVLRSKLSSVLKSVITEMRFDGRNRTVDVQIFDKSKIYRFKQGDLEWQEIVSRIGYATAEEVEGWVQVYQADYNVPQEARVIRETDTGVIMRVRDKEVAAEFTTMTKLVLHRFQEPKGWQRRTKKPHPANANLGDNT